MKIERGIPVPEVTSRRHLAFPWPQMRDGDSILLTRQEAGPDGKKVTRSFRLWARRTGSKLRLIRRTMADGRMRIWCVTKEGAR